MSDNQVKSHSMLTVTHGAKSQFEVDAETAAKYEGTTEHVLSRLIREHGSPAFQVEMQAVLRDPLASLEVFGQDEQGAVEEKPLSLANDWSSIVNMLGMADTEVTFAKTHVGGMAMIFN